MLGWFKKKLGTKKEERGQTAAAPVEAPLDRPEENSAIGAAAPEPPSSKEATQPPAPIAAGVKAAPDAGGGDGKGLFQRLAERLSKTRQTLINRIDGVFAGRRKIDADLFDELEEILITADLGVRTAQDLLENARRRVEKDKLSDPTALKAVLKDLLLAYLVKADRASELAMPADGPLVIMVLGVNGVGKTTTIGKLANKFKQAGNKVLLVAADTFRAAAIDQLKVWAERVGVEISAQQPGADPSSVVYDALDYARPRNFDVIIIDTAGRLHTKVNLMEELKKLKRVAAGKIPGAPHELLLVLDATTGQNGISQARQFNEAVEITGLALTKLDGTAKGGIVVNICHEFDIPIRFIGIGEKMDDLRDFDAREFTEALFAPNGASEGHG